MENKNIWLRPTEQPSDLLLCIKDYTEHIGTPAEGSDKKGNLRLGFGKSANRGFYQPQYVYVTSNENPRDGDWCLDIYTKAIFKIGPWLSKGQTTLLNATRKIALTTEPDLIKEGVQPIEEGFLKWLEKNPKHKEIEVAYVYCKEGVGKVISNMRRGKSDSYLIILPNEEPKCKTVKEPCVQCDGTGETVFSGTYTTQRTCDVCNGKKYWNIRVLIEDTKTGSVTEAIHQVIDGQLKKIKELKQEIVGYRLNPNIDRKMINSILETPMPIWNDQDKSVYFIRGHVAGSLVAKLKELGVIDLWFTPIYEDDEVKSDWVKEHHLEHYHKEGVMADGSKHEEPAEYIAALNEFPEYDQYLERIGFEKGAIWRESQYEILMEEYDQYTIDCMEVELKRPLPFKKWLEDNKKK
jgi:hypothetical protein